MAQVKEVKGPGPRRMGGPKPKVENPGKLLKRIMDEGFKHYLPHCILVLVCIIVSALANVQASLFLKTLIDDYIVPMTKQATPDFSPLAGALVRIGCIYAIGVLAAWLNARIMVNVTQGTLRNLRTQLFTHMESLPISYFDTRPHGDIMSVYTNDIDTLRRLTQAAEEIMWRTPGTVNIRNSWGNRVPTWLPLYSQMKGQRIGVTRSQMAQGITITETEGIASEALLVSTESSYSKAAGYEMTTAEQEDGDPDGPFALAAYASNNSTGAEVIWVNCGNMDNEAVYQTVPGNVTFLQGCAASLAGQEGTTLVESKVLEAAPITISGHTAAVLGLVFVLILPAAVLAVGAVVVLLRRRK